MRVAAILCSVVIACAYISCAPPDPIAGVARKESSNPWFSSGMYSAVALPVTASPLDVAAAALGQPSTNVVLFEARKVSICYSDAQKMEPAAREYMAVLVGTSSGRKVVLLQYREYLKQPGWWNRVYDVE
jgi:hypothetical protein